MTRCCLNILFNDWVSCVVFLSDFSTAIICAFHISAMHIAVIPMYLMASVVSGEESYKAPHYEVFSVLLLLAVS